MPERIRRRIGVTACLALVTGLLLPLGPAAVAQESEPFPPYPTHYVEISDGTLIAINVRMPDSYREGRRYPTIFEMSGYDGGSAGDRTFLGMLVDETGQGGDVMPVQEGSRYLTRPYYDDYVTVHASIRGTGCSTGEFDLFSWRTALDGREVIEWIAEQPWSNGKVGIYGHSFGGITGFMIAATRPPSLTAVTVSGLIDDLYRGLVYPGGVQNTGFPLIWSAVIRTFYDVGGGTGQGVVVGQDAQCAQNLLTHRRNVQNEALIQGLTDTDNDWWRARSLVSYAERIRVPIHLTGAYQDEQTGPRFAHLFELIRGVPKRLVQLNGDHGSQTEPRRVERDRRRWMDHWMRGQDNGFGTRSRARSSVLTLLEVHRNENGRLVPNGAKRSRTFPLKDTRWRDFHFRSDGKLTRRAAGPDEGSDMYVSGSRRQSWSYQAGPTSGSEFTTPDGPDELSYVSPAMKRNTAIIGPILARLHMSSATPETEVFVQLMDIAPDGSRSYLQRGMLRASHRAVDPGLSDWVTHRGERLMYRPFHPHTNPTQVVPGEVNELVVEVFPVGHVFREGHRIGVKIHAPPTLDSYYAYTPRYLPGVNTLMHDADHPSRIMVPVVPLGGTRLGSPIPCGQQDEVRCIPG